MNQFVEKVTTYLIKDSIDVDGPGFCYMSVAKLEDGAVEIVIGAEYRNRCAASFSKEGVGQLISILQDIEKAMP